MKFNLPEKTAQIPRHERNFSLELFRKWTFLVSNGILQEKYLLGVGLEKKEHFQPRSVKKISRAKNFHPAW